MANSALRVCPNKLGPARTRSVAALIMGTIVPQVSTAFNSPRLDGLGYLLRYHRLRSGFLHLARGVELLEVLGEALRQVGGHLVVGGLVLPRITRIQQLGRHAGNRLWNAEAEGWFDFEFHICELAFDQRVDHGARVRQAHALADAVWPALPASVDQPALRLMLPQTAAEHLRIGLRRKRHERRPKARGEGCLGPGDASLGARYFCGITRHEVEHRLLGRELRYRRQNAERIGGEEDYVLRMAAEAGNDRIVDELHRIGGARVLGLAFVVVVGNARERIEHHVLQHRTEAQRVPDLRLVLLREANALGVATAFEVENARRAPAVLIIPDEPAGGIGR